MTHDDVLSRRAFVQFAAGGIGLMSAAPVLLAELASADPASAAELAARRGGTLTMGVAGDPQTLDPHRSTLFVLRHTIRSQVFETLTFVEPNLSISPALAESWTVSHRGHVVTFKLRQGVLFHDGTEFTAKDVKFSVDRVKNPKTASQYAPQVATVKSVDVVSKYVARFNLTAPTPPLFADILQVAMVSEKNAATLNKHPIGTGPFKFVEWIPGNHIKVARNPHYRVKGQPYLDAILMRPMADAQTRITNLQTGAILLDEQMDAKDVKQVQGFSNARVLATKPITQYEMFQINTKRAPFNDKRVRQAMSYAFDRRAYAQAFWYGLARPGDNPFVVEMLGYLPGLDFKYNFDLKKADALLKAAGFSNSHPLKMQILNPLGYPTLHNMSVLLQNNLNSLGHQVTVRDMELSAWVNQISAKGDFDVTTDVYASYPEDPTGMFNSDNLAPTFNINRFNPPGYKHLVDQAATATNAASRVRLYQQLERLLLDEVPMIVVDHIPNLLGASKRLHGLVLGPSAVWNYAGAYIA